MDLVNIFKFERITQIYIFCCGCCTLQLTTYFSDIRTFSKTIFNKGLTLALIPAGREISVTQLLSTEYNHIALAVDMSCKESIAFMNQVSVSSYTILRVRSRYCHAAIF